jgi:hypothetical protein
MKRNSLGLILLAGMFVLISGCSKSTPTAETNVVPNTSISGTSTGLDGKALLEQRCVSCHSLSKIYSRTGDESFWQKQVTDMIKLGSVLTKDEEATLVKYLADNLK